MHTTQGARRTACLAMLLVVLLGVAAAQRRRTVDCAGTALPIPPGAIETFYSIGLTNETLNFDALAFLASAGTGGGVDVAEFFVTLNSLKAFENSNGGGQAVDAVAAMVAQWNATWATLGGTLFQEGTVYAADGDVVSAASAFHRAAMYLQLAGRFGNLLAPEALRVYNKSIDAFARAVVLPSPQFPTCTPVEIPYTPANGGGATVGLHAYWCPAARASKRRRQRDGGANRKSNSSGTPTIVTVNGFDGTAEMQYHSIAVAAVQRGINCLVVEGPGQGLTARTSGLPFVPDWERVTSVALTYAIEQFTIDPTRVILWGESFGGYLAPRGFAFDARFAALVANGGVYDFYQALLCKLPEGLVHMYLEDVPAVDAAINAIMRNASAHSMALAFALRYAALGFHTTDYTAFLDALLPYSFLNVSAAAPGFAQRPVFVFSPAWDTLVGNQSAIFYAYATGGAGGGGDPSKRSVLVSQDPMRGTALHCAVGSTANLNIAVHRWIDQLWV